MGVYFVLWALDLFQNRLGLALVFTLGFEVANFFIIAYIMIYYGA